MLSVQSAQPCTIRPSGAAQDSNLPTHGLHALADFEGQTGFAQRSGLKDVCAPGRALEVRCFALTSLGLVSASLGAWDGQGCGRDVPAIWRVSTSSACARCSGVLCPLLGGSYPSRSAGRRPAPRL